MTLDEIYEFVRTDDLPTPGRYAHPYSEAAERITGRQAGEEPYKGRHAKEMDR